MPQSHSLKETAAGGLALAALLLLFVSLHISGYGFGSHGAHGMHH